MPLAILQKCLLAKVVKNATTWFIFVEKWKFQMTTEFDSFKDYFGLIAVDG